MSNGAAGADGKAKQNEDKPLRSHLARSSHTNTHTAAHTNNRRVRDCRLVRERETSQHSIMTMSGGLGSDSTTAVYSEDVVTYADPDAAHEWDEDGWTDGAVGLVSQVAGASDEEDSEWEDEEHEVRRVAAWGSSSSSSSSSLSRLCGCCVFPSPPRSSSLLGPGRVVV